MTAINTSSNDKYRQNVAIFTEEIVGPRRRVRPQGLSLDFKLDRRFDAEHEPCTRCVKRPRLASKVQMDSPPSPSRHLPSRAPQRAVRHSSIAAGEGSSGGNNRPGRNALWRGHSDSDVFGFGLGPYSSMIGAGGGENDGETWMDFLREGSGDEALGGDRQAQVEARRATMMAVDRKRRLTAHEDDLARRRSSSGPIFGHAPVGVVRPSMPPPPQRRIDSAMSGSGLARSNVVDLSSPERPLPRRSTQDSLRDRNREVVLPRWQPDSEVSKCPICGTHFSFWYRKHHCRKCGRVVCASCSPHRITIPRQYIVHPPMDASSGFTTARPTNIEVVDLTGDGDESTAAVSTAGRNQAEVSSPGGSRRIDAALGGGQEVRLCNPCVPDPNPLPPPGYTLPHSNAQSMPPPLNLRRSEPSVPPGVIVDRPQRPSSLYSGATDVSSSARASRSRAESSTALNMWHGMDGSAPRETQMESLESFLRRRRRRDIAVSQSPFKG